MKVDLSQAFPAPINTPRTKRIRDYDVNITLNENGSKSMKVRFGFLNDAAAASKDYSFVEVSSPVYSNDHLFFRFFSERQHRKTYKLSERSGKHDAFTFSITPSKEESKAYRKYWIGKKYSMLYDEESGLYYISNLISKHSTIPFKFLN